LHSTGVRPVRVDESLVSLRLLCDRRDELGALRTQAVCRFHRLLAELTPGGTGRGLTARRAQQLLDNLRPSDAVAEVRLDLAREHLADIRAVDAKMAAVRMQIAALVEQTGTTLTLLYGIGPIIAGRLLAEVEDVTRFPSKDHFASYNGTAPIDASSGEQVRHRLSRMGNRRINHALHIMAVTQVRQPNSAGRGYYERKRLEGKTPKEALRCLKRRLSDLVFRQMMADHARPTAVAASTIKACGSATTRKPTRPTSASRTGKDRHPATPPKPNCRKALAGSSPSTGKVTASSASKSSMPAPGSHQRSSKTPTGSADRNTASAVPHSRRSSAPAAGVKAGAATRTASALTAARTTTSSSRGKGRKPSA
jgi:transposase